MKESCSPVTGWAKRSRQAWEHLALQELGPERALPMQPGMLGVAVQTVAQQRMTGLGHMHANLVGSARGDGHFQQTVADLSGLIQSTRYSVWAGLPPGITFMRVLRSGSRPMGPVKVSVSLGRHAVDQGQVGFFHLALGQRPWPGAGAPAR